MILQTRIYNSPLGELHLGAVETGLCLLDFPDTGHLQGTLDDLRRWMPDLELQNGSNCWLEQAAAELDAYFTGKSAEFKTPLVFPGTPFQVRVWNHLLTIPSGQTQSYEAVAVALGDVKSIRAAAHANGQNRISIIIPCHRVIQKNGRLGGYGGGLWRKRWLLDHEQRMTGATGQMALL